MTLQELDDSLPNGFHDAYFRSIAIDYERRTVTITSSILVGLPDEAPGMRDRMRDAVVVIEGLEFVSIEPPAERNDYKPGRPLWVDFVGRGTTGGSDGETAGDCFVGEFYVHDWNSTIRLSGRNVRLVWVDEGAERPRP